MNNHEGQSCENCAHSTHCMYYLFDHALWCMFWAGENSKSAEDAETTAQADEENNAVNHLRVN